MINGQENGVRLKIFTFVMRGSPVKTVLTSTRSEGVGSRPG